MVDTDQNIVGRNTSRLEALWMHHFARNLPYILKSDKSLRTIRDSDKHKDSPAIVVGAGPSLYIHKHLDLLKESSFGGVIVATDRMLIPLLKKGITPHYVVSIDGSEHIPPFYKHKLVKTNATEISVLLGAYCSPNVAKIIMRYKMDVYWFIPTFDKKLVFATATKINPNGLLGIRPLGNTGASAWVLSWSILKCNPTCLIGFDFGYPEGTPLETTGYYSGALKLVPQDPIASSIIVSPKYPTIYHPIFHTKAKTDPVYTHYREAFLESIRDLPLHIKIFNCTEGGTLFGNRIECVPFARFLKDFRYFGKCLG